MRGKTFLWRHFVTGAQLIFCSLLMMTVLSCKEKLEFNLGEFSVFQIEEQLRSDFVRGVIAQCRERPDGAKAYPAFKSGKPLYGSVRFYGPPADAHLERGYFAIDESGGTGQGYDRLYFDRNCDLDLTNDTPLKADPEPPSGALLKYSSIEQQVCFDNLDITFDFGSAGKRAIEIMPGLLIRKGQQPEVRFVATKIRRGAIKFGGAKYDVLLGYSYGLGSPLDQPGTIFFLVPEDDPQNFPRWWGGDILNAVHAVGGKHYRFATTPTGDKFFVRPYEGELGTFEVGAGGRDIKGAMMRGSLRSQDMAAAVGGELERGWPKPAQKCRVPVGDYLPSYLMISFGRLSIFLSNNYHSDGKPGGGGNRPKVYGIKIRKDEPYVFDLSEKPEVIFASPAKNHRVKLGEQLPVKAVLIDPKLDIMVRGLYDTTQKPNVSLDPKVVITRANGEIVGQGVMPFG